jgi:hypothetical protein
MGFERYSRSPATGWKSGRDFTQFANSFERKIDAVVLGDLFPHRFHLGVGFILNPVHSGFRTLGHYRVSERPFAALPIPDRRIATWKLYNRAASNLLAVGALVPAGIRAAFPRIVCHHVSAREVVGRDCRLRRNLQRSCLLGGGNSYQDWLGFLHCHTALPARERLHKFFVFTL